MLTDIEPTAEHIAEARALRPEGRPDEYEQWCQTHEGTDQDWHDWCVARALAAAEARGFERGQKANPAAVWGWAAAVGNGWLLCPMVRGDQLVVDVNDVRGMIFGEPGREGYAAVRRFVNREYSKRVRRKTMEGARSALSKLMGESIPALPDSKEPR